MNSRHLLLLPSAAALLTLAGCTTAVHRQTFQSAVPTTPIPANSFLPAELASAAAEEAASAVAEEKPEPQKPTFLSSSLPAIDFKSSQPPTAKLDLVLQQAELRFQSGKRFQQIAEYGRARAEFDAALDLLLNAKPETAFDRTRLEQQRESLVNRIYKFDLDAQEAADSEEVGAPPAGDKAPLDDVINATTFPVDPKLRLKVQEEIEMTASDLPLQLADPVVSFINYFSSDQGRRKLLFGLRRQGKYRAMIERVLTEEGLPKDLIYLAQAESAFIPNIRSRASAVGLWQFMSYTGNQYGLKQTAFVDDRMDPEASTRAAARHLKDMYKRYGDWYLAIAAYNCGPGCVDNAVARTGYADFWELRARRAVPIETTNYVPIIVAFAIMMKNPSRYDLVNIEQEAPLHYDTIVLTAPTSLSLVSGLIDLPVSELQDLNPSLLGGIAPAGFNLKVPVDASATLLASLDKVPVERRANVRVHRLADGETLATVARAYRVTGAALAALNTASADLRTGDMVFVPAATIKTRVIRNVKNSRLSAAASAGRGSSQTARVAPRTSSKKRSSARQTATSSKRPAVVHPRGATSLARK